MISSNNIIRQTNKYQTTNSHFDKFITTNANTHLVSTQVKSKKSLSNVARSFLTTSTVIFGSYITPSSATTVRKSDEFDVEIRTEFLGLSLAEIKKDDNILVTVQSIRDDADMMIKQVIRPGMILIAIGDNVVEGYSGKEVVNLFKSISKPTQLTFRDPVLFFDKLNTTKVYGTGVGMNTGSVGVGVRGGAIIDTTVNFATNETLRVQRLNVSFMNTNVVAFTCFVTILFYRSNHILILCNYVFV